MDDLTKAARLKDALALAEHAISIANPYLPREPLIQLQCILMDLCALSAPADTPAPTEERAS
jgi:hypothetical protein